MSGAGSGSIPWQHLLFQAGWAIGEKAVAAWREWLVRVDWLHNEIDPGSYTLLPLVYHNLTRGGAGESALPESQVAELGLGRLRGIYRRAWVVSETHLRRIGSALALLGRAGISVVLPDGAALALRFYPLPACRPIPRQTLWLPSRQIRVAVGLLRGAGWRVATRLPAWLAALRNRSRGLWPLVDDQGCLLLLQAIPRSGLVLPTETLPVGEGVARVLAPTTQLLELGRQARRVPAEARVPMLADAACLVRVAGNLVDWSRVRCDRATTRLLRQLALVEDDGGGR